MSKKLKLGYFADGPWSHNAFKKIVADANFEIKFICARFDSTDETLLSFSKKYNIPYYKEKQINSSQFLQEIDKYKCDLLVSMSFNQIFKQEILNLTPGGIINCHAGLLPFYRGRNILNWALINDEKEFGITVHHVDLGIDTGDIILQRRFPITDESTYGSLLEVAYVECAEILYDTLKLIQQDKASRVVQKTIHETGFYCGRRQVGDEIINWSQSSRELFNFIRAVSQPGPQATCHLGGVAIKINKARFVAQAPRYSGVPGQVLATTDSGYLIKTKDSFLEIQEVSTKLKVGDRLT